MTYYGIVDKIKRDHKNGVYGRRRFTEEEKTVFAKSLILDSTFYKKILNLIFPLPMSIYRMFNKNAPLKLQYGTPESTRRELIFHDSILDNEYDISENTDLFYGLFDGFILKDSAFQRIMKSKGGSTLIILERNSIPKNWHFGGESGKFSTGLYCSHPKDENILIPLENSNELIKTFILEETLRAYEALGAKKILIEDKTEVNSKIGGTAKKVNIDLGEKYKKEILREKSFGKGVFDKERALNGCLFIHDFPNVISTINGRINGNQLSEKFTESINLGIGLDLTVLSLFKANLNFEYNRKWHFEVEFYDKNEMNLGPTKAEYSNS